jgi:hypothetical protein
MARGAVMTGKAKLIRIVDGDIDFRDAPYNCWRSTLCGLCLELLDLSQIDLWQQADNYMHIGRAMEHEWTYKGGLLSDGNFNKHVVAIHKYKR